jgi:hypothetical protein
MIVGVSAIFATIALFAWDIQKKRKAKKKKTDQIRVCITGGPYAYPFT